MNHFYRLLLLVCAFFAVTVYCMDETGFVFTDNGHNTIRQIAIVKDKIIAAAGNIIKVWDLKTRALVHGLDHGAHVYQLEAANNEIIAVSDEYAQKWALDTGKMLARYPASPMDSQNQIVRGGRIIYFGLGERVDVSDLATKMFLFALVGHNSYIKSLGGSDTQIITGSCDRTARVWNLNDGKCVAILAGHDYPVDCVALIGIKALTADCDTIRIWSINDSRVLRTLKSHGVPWSLAMDGEFVAAGLSQGMVQVWHDNKPEFCIEKKCS